MLSIADALPSTRYLMIAATVSETRWKNECEAVRTFLDSDQSKIDAIDAERMRQIVNSPLPTNTIPLVVIHCYADVPSGTQYDLAFDPANPECVEPTDCSVQFGVVLSRVVEKSLSHGWHQTAILRFPNGLPKLFDNIDVDAVGSNYIGLCSKSDFQEIKASIVNAG